MFKRKKTVITKLQGGLGNQMFQYAIAKGIGFERVFFDLSFLRKNCVSTNEFTAREFELLIFKNITYKEIFKRHFKFLKSKKINKLLGLKFNFVTQVENEFVTIDKNTDVIYLDGYFQSEKYFFENRLEILKGFEFPLLDNINMAIQNKIESIVNSVSIHIRRGDYLKETVKNYHGLLDKSYYDKSIETINDRLENTHFFVFSDDINYAYSTYGHLSNYTIIEGNDKEPWKDMCLITHCKHHIIANSSFSWWGAWLSTKEGINIAPLNWFNPKVAQFEVDDFIPNHWLKIGMK